MARFIVARLLSSFVLFFAVTLFVFIVFFVMPQPTIRQLGRGGNASDYDIHNALRLHGTLPDQSLCERDDDALREAIAVNFTSYACLLIQLANVMEAQARGSLVAIGSAAGDRGKRRNYIYGAAKGGVAILLEGLMGRLARAGVRVTLVKPGFVDTPMTAAFAKGPLWISSDRAGRIIVRAIRKGKTTVYVPGFWRWIMAVLRVVPQRLFARLDL